MPGGGQPSYDKQFVRDYGASGWNKNSPPPPLPPVWYLDAGEIALKRTNESPADLFTAMTAVNLSDFERRAKRAAVTLTSLPAGRPRNHAASHLAQATSTLLRVLAGVERRSVGNLVRPGWRAVAPMASR